MQYIYHPWLEFRAQRHDRHITGLHFEVKEIRMYSEQCCSCVSYLFFCGDWAVVPLCVFGRLIEIFSSQWAPSFWGSSYFLTLFAVIGRNLERIKYRHPLQLEHEVEMFLLDVMDLCCSNKVKTANHNAGGQPGICRQMVPGKDLTESTIGTINYSF